MSGRGGSGSDPARPVPHREVPGPPLRVRAEDRPRDVGLQGLRPGRQPVHADLGRVQGAAAEDGPHGHPLRDPLDQARHDVGGRPDPARPRARPARPTPHVVAHSEQGYTANLPLAVLDDDDVCWPTRSTAGRSSSSTAGRFASSCRSATSGRAPSGCAASSSSTTTSSASGSATATTTTPTPGRKSATRNDLARRARGWDVDPGPTRPSGRAAVPIQARSDLRPQSRSDRSRALESLVARTRDWPFSVGLPPPSQPVVGTLIAHWAAPRRLGARDGSWAVRDDRHDPSGVHASSTRPPARARPRRVGWRCCPSMGEGVPVRRPADLPG